MTTPIIQEYVLDAHIKDKAERIATSECIHGDDYDDNDVELLSQTVLAQHQENRRLTAELAAARERIDEVCYTHNELLESHVASQSNVFRLTDERDALAFDNATLVLQRGAYIRQLESSKEIWMKLGANTAVPALRDELEQLKQKLKVHDTIADHNRHNARKFFERVCEAADWNPEFYQGEECSRLLERIRGFVSDARRGK
jgi:hypothetical protein